MKNRLFILVSVLLCAASAEITPCVVTGAPFKLTIPEWTPPQRDFTITDYGATPEAQGLPITEPLEKAIAAAHDAGGGRVIVPAGTWLCGAFRLKSNVALVLDKGAQVHFPDDPVIVMRAPLRANGRPTMTHAALVGANNCTNIAIMGEGMFKCDVTYWHRNFEANPQKGFPRPQMLHFANCKVVKLEDFKVRGSPAWTLHFCVCEDIIMRGVDSVATGCNTDGLDLESCRRALIENCSLDQTDDTYTIKSGFNERGRKRNIPTEDVVIRNCRCVHGHTLLAIGSEVSGGIRNIYMTDCTVESQAWNWLFVKTNAKRGAFVENVWMENIRGRRANNVVNVEMYYDGNPNKELGKKMAKTWVTAISNIVARNVVCAEADRAVKVRGDIARPPVGIRVENVRVGRIRRDLVKVEGAQDVVTKDVREDVAAVNEIEQWPAQVRLADPEKDAAGELTFDRIALEAYSANAIARRVLMARIAAEVTRNRNVAPRVTPIDYAHGPETYEGNYSRRFDQHYAAWGCAVPGALILDDVRQVAYADKTGRTDRYLGVEAALAYDAPAEAVTVRLVNGGEKALKDVFLIVHLSPDFLTTRQTFRVPDLKPGERFVRTFNVGVGAHYLPRPRSPACFAVSADFTYGTTRSRLWCTQEVAAAHNALEPNATALHVGPVDRSQVDEQKLQRLSGADGALVDLGTQDAARWKSVHAPDADWTLVSPFARAYTTQEANLVRSGRAYEAVALQFVVLSNGVTTLRCTAALWTKQAKVFLNGQAIALKGKVMEVPTRVGLNRVIVLYPSKPGLQSGALQLATYSWSSQMNWACVPFKPSVPPPSVCVKGPIAFPLEWNLTRRTDVPYEVEISEEKMARLLGVKKGSAYVVTAQTAHGDQALPVTILPGRTAENIVLRFTPPKGTTALTCRVAGVRAPEKNLDCGNLFAGQWQNVARWEASPRMAVTHAADGVVFTARESNCAPEALCYVDVPSDWAGKPVRVD